MIGHTGTTAGTILITTTMMDMVSPYSNILNSFKNNKLYKLSLCKHYCLDPYWYYDYPTYWDIYNDDLYDWDDWNYWYSYYYYFGYDLDYDGDIDWWGWYVQYGLSYCIEIVIL